MSDDQTQVYVCGLTCFVKTATSALVSLGRDTARIRTERFGGMER